jgi:hypothetical protein
LSAVQHADEIVVFKDGQIVERGNHQDLILQCGIYAGLWLTQAGFSEESASDAQRDSSQPDLDIEMETLEAGRLEEAS